MIMDVYEQLGIFSRGFVNDFDFTCKTVRGPLAEWITEQLDEKPFVKIYFP